MGHHVDSEALKSLKTGLKCHSKDFNFMVYYLYLTRVAIVSYKVLRGNSQLSQILLDLPKFHYNFIQMLKHHTINNATSHKDSKFSPHSDYISVVNCETFLSNLLQYILSYSYVCVVLCSLVMSLYACDFFMGSSLILNTSSRLTAF